MNKLICAVAILLTSTGASATEQLSYDGHLIFGTGNFQAGEAFSGQFTFNPSSPDWVGYSQNTPPYTGLVLDYRNNTSSSVVINGSQPLIGNARFALGFDTNVNVTQPMIDYVGLNGKINPGIYDDANLFSIQYQDINKPLGDVTIFGIYAAFAVSTFSATDIQNKNYQNIFNQNLQPLALWFRIDNLNGGVTQSTGIGSINQYNVAAIPVPAAVWLFASGLIGLPGLARKHKAV